VVARRAVDGVVEATKEVGGNAGEVAQKAVEGAIEAAGSIGNVAVKAVKDILVGVVGGIKEVASAALPEEKPAPPSTPGEGPRTGPDVAPKEPAEGAQKRGKR
jgi:hypothetical protein